MAKEIERKYLVRSDFKHLSVRHYNIHQTYISIDPVKVLRLRISGDTAYLTLKGSLPGNSITRNEWEYEIPLADANEILNICLPGKIIKTRYLVPSGKHMFEVDVFHDKNEGLIIAEIELSFEDEVFEIPEWLGEEVTGNPSYYNSNLIK